MSDEVEKAALKQKIDEAIREAKRREVGATYIGPYKSAVYMLSQLKKLIDEDMSKEERYEHIKSFSGFLTHMLEPADREFCHQLDDISYQHRQLFNMVGFRS